MFPGRPHVLTNSSQHLHWSVSGEERCVPYIVDCLQEEPGVVVAASDYVKTLPDSVARWVPQSFMPLGTDGYGRSDSREALRDFFEVDARFITLATLDSLAGEGLIEYTVVSQARDDLKIDPEKPYAPIS